MTRSIKVLLFATMRDQVGSKSIELDLPEGANVAQLKDHLVARYPGLTAAMGSVIVAIDRKFVNDEDEVPAGVDVALFPPVSGG